MHVLLDRKGKTLSHAFVEVAVEEVARAALRSAQNSVLGKGKRARGVTVTRSSQEELLRAVRIASSFPFLRNYSNVVTTSSYSRVGRGTLIVPALRLPDSTTDELLLRSRPD